GNLSSKVHAPGRPLSVPLGNSLQQRARSSPHDCKVVIGKENSPISEPVEDVQFFHNLLRILPTLLAPKVLDDVAKFTFEGAPARRLHLRGGRYPARI